jgi:hypothetical protein
VEPIAEPLSFFGSEADCAPLDWSWVDEQLTRAGTYWVVPRGPAAPHPRPVWGVWQHQRLLLSVGSQVVGRQLRDDPTVTVHLESGTDVVIVEGRVDGQSVDGAAIEQYDAKYQWSYTIDEYGPLTVVAPSIVLAWRSGGWAGRDGFQSAGRWRVA